MSEWMLSKDIFAAAMKKLDITPNIDFFASQIYCQLIPYLSYRLDPESCAVDAFFWTGPNMCSMLSLLLV